VTASLAGQPSSW